MKKSSRRWYLIRINWYPHNKGKFGHSGAQGEDTVRRRMEKRPFHKPRREAWDKSFPRSPQEKPSPVTSERRQTRRAPADVPAQEQTLDSYPETKML